jgi:glutamate/tyrosine decarboxylase-like PLP-dependent enzyme
VRSYGAEAFGAHLDWCLDAAEWVAEEVSRRAEHLRVLLPPTLSVATFYLPPEWGVGRGSLDCDTLVRWLAADINSRGRVLVAPTKVGSMPCLRVCVLSSKTQPSHLSAIVEDLVAAEGAVVDALHRFDRERASNPGHVAQ